MRTHARLAVWISVIALLALGLTGCFRTAGDDLEPTPQSSAFQVVDQTPTDGPPQATSDDLAPTVEQLTPLASPVGPPTLTPFPTIGPELTNTQPAAEGQGGPFIEPPTPTGMAVSTNTPLPQVAPQGVPQVTNTALPTAAIQATNTPRPTDTPPPTLTSTPRPTNTSAPTRTPQPTRTPLPTNPPAVGPTLTFTAVPFSTFPPSPTYTPYSPFAMIMPVEAQPLAERPPEQVAATPYIAPTQVVAAAPVQPVATNTPVPVPTEVIAADVPQGGGTPPLEEPVAVAAVQQATLSPGQMTATMIVYEATATIAALTGTPLATWTPIPGQGGALDTQPVQAVPAGQFPPNATVITATPFGQGGICAEHTISLGETLFTIARRYGVTAEQIQARNPALIPTIDQINAGDTILIPCAVTPTPTVPVVPVVTSVPAGQGGPVGAQAATTGTIIHTVVPGDTLFSIARQYGVDIFDLLAANGFTQATMNFIYEGDQIRVPNQVVTPVAPVAAQAQPGVAPTLTPYIVIITPVGQ